MATVNNDGETPLKENKTTTSTSASDIKDNNVNQSSTSSNTTSQEAANSEASTNSKSQDSFEQAFFFGLSIDDAVNSTENLMELFYNACKFNHFELVKRCTLEKNINVNQLFNNDYPLCIAR